MHPHLETCLATLRTATKGAGDECNVRRDPAKWSVAEVVEHLSRAYSGTAKGFERCVEKGTPLASATTLKQRVSQFAVINLGWFPEGRQAPKHILPTGEVSIGAVIEAAAKNLQWLDDAAIKTRSALGTGKMLDHPILGALTVDQWLAFHVSHTHHHAKQIRARR
ncbi:MAG TPA: DinB family protein [Vicinamibacterales bacterium]|nr:DinB family protein [Vicinamibacterales bacterium]